LEDNNNNPSPASTSPNTINDITSGNTPSLQRSTPIKVFSDDDTEASTPEAAATPSESQLPVAAEPSPSPPEPTIDEEPQIASPDSAVSIDNTLTPETVAPASEQVDTPSTVSGPVPADTKPEENLSSASDSNPQVVTPISGSNSGKKGEKGSKVMALLIILIVLAAVGGGAYYFLKHKTADKSSAASAAVVEKDIPNIRYATANFGWETFYPGIDDSSSYVDSSLPVFEGLVRFENKTQIVPLLATGWTNPDASTWVFNLRTDVKFHNGRAMTADDVKLSFDAAKATSLGLVYANTIKSVTVTGTNQVTIITSVPDATLLRKLTGYFVYDTKSGKTNDAINGTGPFTVKAGTTPTPKSLELVAFDQYWGGRPHVRSLSFTGLNDYDHEKAYGDNKADIMTTFADSPTAVGTRKYSEQKLDQSSVFMMPLNTLKAGTPLAKLQVRQAIQLALDPLAIAKVRSTAAIPATQIVPSSIPGYDPSITRPARDVAQAKTLLTQAGYPSGISFTLTYFAPSQTTAVEMQKELAEAGIKLVLDQQTDPQTMLAKAFKGGTDSFFETYTSDYFDGSDVLSTFYNTPNYKNQTVVDLVAKANSTLDTTKRLGYLKQASHAMATDLGVEPVFVQSGDSIIYDASYVITRDVANNSLGIYFQKVYAK
jgi:peptide/nickel transport system substrate-binding protein